MTRPSNPKRRRKSSNVPAQALGYSLQFTRMPMMLLESGPGGLVSFEVIEDVREDSADGTRKSVHTKSALSDNPVGDHSVELWKTIANCVEALQEHTDDT